MINFQPGPYGQMQMPYTFNPYQQMTSQPIQTQSTDPQIIYCDGLDYVKSQNVRMDGQGSYYAKTDGTEIYCKKLKSDGSSKIDVYAKVSTDDVPEVPQNNISDDIKVINDNINGLNNGINNIYSEMASLKELVEDILKQPSVPAVIDAVPQKKGVFK